MTLALKIGIDAPWQDVVRATKKMRENLLAEVDGLSREKKKLERTVGEIQSNIRFEVERRWPGAAYPYTYRHTLFLRDDLDIALRYITTHNQYQTLVNQQDRDFQLDGEILEYKRKISHLDRVLRLRKLAKILGEFERIATDEELVAYHRLVECEGTSPW
jgi:hypothetical protein